MSFSELEHLLDGLEGKKESNGNDKQDVEDIDLKYDQNNLKISEIVFAYCFESKRDFNSLYEYFVISLLSGLKLSLYRSNKLI
jgi:hypothetical protein